MQILGDINDITIVKDVDKTNKIKIRVVESEEDDTIISKIELYVDEHGRIKMI